MQQDEPGAPPGGTTVAEVTQRLDALRDRPLVEHAEVYESVHDELRAALTRIEQA